MRFSINNNWKNINQIKYNRTDYFFQVLSLGLTMRATKEDIAGK